MFSFSNIAQYLDDLRTQKTSCAAAVDFYLQNIHNNAHLNAFVNVFEDEARSRARELDRARADGAPLKSLHGVVISIKDVICLAGKSVTAASKMLKGFKSLYTATALQFLLDEEAIIIGTCNCDEFAMGSGNEHSAYGPVRNGLDESRVPGGSSGGSAVSVQMKMCMLALGSDTGGSVRQPADFCGVIGYKPSYGTVSRYGLIAYASSFDQIGIFGASITDVRTALFVMSQFDHRDSTMSRVAVKPIEIIATDRKLRIAFLQPNAGSNVTDKEMVAAMNAFQNKLAARGHETDHVRIDLLDVIVPAYYVLTTAEASSNLGRYDGVRYGHRSELKAGDIGEFYTNNRTEGFGKEVKRRIMLGNFVLSAGYYDAYCSKAQQVRRLLTEQTARIFEQFDALIMPVSPGIAPKLGSDATDPVATYLADIFTVFANLTGVPAIALPLFSHSANMPFGIQVHAKRGADIPLLNIAEILMRCAETEA